MTQSPTTFANYKSDFQAVRHDRASNGPAWITELGDQAWSRFTQLGFPTARRGNEKWKYTNVAPIARTDFGFSWDLTPDLSGDIDSGRTAPWPVAPWEEEWTNLVFVDGRFSRALSAAPGAGGGVTVTSLAEVIISGAQALEQCLAKHACFQDDGFTALNTAFLRDGAFVQVPDGCDAGAAVNLVFVTTDRAQPRVSFPRTLIMVGNNARLTVVESYVGPPGEQYFTNAVTEIAAGDRSEVEHYRLSMESPQAFHVGATRVSQGQNSVFASASFATGAALARNDFQVLLDGSGGSCFLNGLYLTADNQHMDNLISIDHAKPYTTSRLNYKGILDGKSRAVFGGQVLVRKDAQKVDAQQTDKNLLLSEQAEVDSKPSLLIYADDVKCGHGATAGHVDKDAMFYLRSRGLDPQTASRMLIHAFASEIIETVKLELLKRYLDELFMDTIPAGSLRIGSGP